MISSSASHQSMNKLPFSCSLVSSPLFQTLFFYLQCAGLSLLVLSLSVCWSVVMLLSFASLNVMSNG